jgi:hypothetical protein
LGILPFDNLCQYVAADINRDGSVTIVDVIELRKTLLGINTGFPNNTSWRFGPVEQDVSGTDIRAFKESVDLLSPGSQTYVDMLGIKVGDISGSRRNRSLPY